MQINEETLLSPVMATYSRFPITLTKGSGSTVWDDQGKAYLDYTSGIATCNLGHVPEQVKEKVTEQLNTLWHCSNLYHIPSQEKLAEKLVEKSCADQVFFCNSGAEANEAAIKIARRYAQKVKKTDQFEVVTFTQSFHGRTLATLTATGQEKIQDGFYPLMEGFRYLPYNDMEALKEVPGEKTCAVLLELIQGEGGVIPAGKEWIAELKKVCEAHGLLFMVDEIQTGIGRTGTLFAYEQYGIEPDVITLAKGLGSGIPIGAVLAKEHVAKAFSPGTHGSTFGGNPIATTAGVATLETIEAEGILQNAAKMGEKLKSQLEALKTEFPNIISDIRGKGLLLGVETKLPAIDIVNKMRDQGVLILVAGPQVVRILPPLNTTEKELGMFIDIFKQTLNNL